MANLTDQQSVAVSTKAVSVVLSSGAGCGKTHVLTERYLSHLRDDEAEVHQIVAITFTDRAARQMRARIRTAVVRHLREAPTEEEADVWAAHLRALETAPISTIHAFCGNILRANAIEANLDPNFEVLEDVLSINLETESLQLCLQNLLTSTSTAGKDLRELVLLYGWRTVVDAVESLLDKWDERPWTDWLSKPTADTINQWLELSTQELMPRFLAHTLSIQTIFSRTIDTLCKHPPATPEMTDNVALLCEWLPKLDQADDFAGTVHRLHEAAKVQKGGKKAWPDPDTFTIIKDTFTELRAALKKLPTDAFTVVLPDEESTVEGELEKCVLVGRRVVRVVREVMHTYHQRKRMHSVVDFQDLLLLTRNLLRDHTDVRQRLQDRYRFLLIDELQDTDPVQMELVDMLCGAGKTSGKLFCVGDASQSVYRFRGADVHRFRQLEKNVPHQGRLQLTLNFRSQPAILDFANALLGHRLANYENLRAHHPQINPDACVEFLWAPTELETASSTSHKSHGSATEGRLAEADWIARRLVEMLDAGEPSPLVVDRASRSQHTLRGVRAGDIVLLFRSMSNVHLYEAALRKYGLHYYLVGGRAFFAQQEIYDILNLLRALENPQDGVSLAGTLRSPFCCLSDEALFLFSTNRAGLWAGLADESLLAKLPHDQQARAERARTALSRWHQIKDRLPIARLLGLVFEESGYDASTQFEPLADRKLANLWKIVDLARTFDRSGLFGLAEFIERLGDLVATQSREEQAATQPENADVIRIMSIHQAKGLEFPVVVIPDIVTRGGPRYTPIAQWDSTMGLVVRPPSDAETPPFPEMPYQVWKTRNDLEEWDEDIRTLYVACTRAQDYLMLSSSLPDNHKPDTAWMHTLTERFDITSGQCLVPGLPADEIPKVRVTSPNNPPSLQPPSTATTTQSLLTIPTWRELQPPTPTEPERISFESEPEHPLRRVLHRWNIADPTAWTTHLGPELTPDETHFLGDMIAAFLDSNMYTTWMNSPKCQRGVRFTLSRDSNIITGIIDCVFQDESDAWNLVLFDFEPKKKLETVWKNRYEEMTCQVEAMQRLLGQRPANVYLHNFTQNRTLKRSGKRIVIEPNEPKA